MIYIGTSRKRVANCAAETRCRAAERFDFGRVVVRFVLEHQQPLFVLAVNVNGYFYGTSVDFLALVKVFQQTVFFEFLCRQCRNIHKANRLVSASEFGSVRAVFGVSILDIRRFYLCSVDYRSERSVTAVVAPIGIYHTDFRDSRVAVFALEIVLTKLYIAVIHRKTVLCNKLSKFLVGFADKTVKRFNFGGNIIAYFQRIFLFKAAFARLNRVYQIVLDTVELIIGNIAL